MNGKKDQATGTSGHRAAANIIRRNRTTTDSFRNVRENRKEMTITWFV